MRFFRLLLILFALLVIPTASFAAVTVTVEGTAVQAGETAFINIYLKSDADSTDLLDAFTLAVLITPLDGASPDLQFTDPPLDPQLSDPAYIFPLADSAAASALPFIASLISTTVPTNPNDTYQGGDGTISGSGYFVPTTNTLLATIQVVASPGAGLGRFEISIIAGATAFFGPLPADPNDPVPELAIDALVPGIAEIVPEPSTLVSMAGFLLLGLARSVVYRRKSKRQSAA
jgi:hypothetical protein